MADPTILELVNESQDELVLPRITTVVSNTSPDGRLFLQLVKRSAQDLIRKPENGWTILQRLHTFNSASGTAEYALPSDFDGLIINTIWNRTQITPLTGPLGAATWQEIKSGLIASGLYFQRYRIVRSLTTIARKFTIDPTPSAIEALAFEYRSNAPFANTGLTTVADAPAADTDVCLLDRNLMVLNIKWRFRRARGEDFTSELAEFNELLDERIAVDATASALDLTAGQGTATRMIGWNNIPDSGYG